ncbi:MAG: ABC transporter ATP-binding protein [Acidimicrobiales bacterium]
MTSFAGWRMLHSGPVDDDATISRELLLRVWGFARRYKRKIAALLLLIVASSLLGAIPPLLYRAVIDKAIGERRIGLLNVLCLAILLVAFAGTIAQVASRWFVSHVGEGVIFDLRVALFDHIQGMPVSFFTRSQTGAVTSRLTNDLQGGHRVFMETLSSMAATVLSLAVTLVAMFVLEWRLTLLALVIAPLFIVVTRRMRGRLHKLMAEQMDANAGMNAQMTERFQVGGALLMKLFGQPRRETAGFSARAGRLREVGIDTAVYSRVFHGMFGLVAAVGIGVVYWAGGRMAIDGTLTLGTIVAFTAYLTQLYGPMTMLAGARVDLAGAVVSFQRVFEVLDFPSAIAEREGAVVLDRPAGRAELAEVWFRYPRATDVTLTSLEGEHTDSGYDERAWVLQDVSFTIEPGRSVALVGPSGAGKTTIAMLLPRIYDATAGVVKVEGHDVRDLSIESLAGAVGMVLQDSHLFHDTIRHNLLYARPDATEAEMIEVARAARIHDLVASLPDGYDTVVGERGHRLSGGEKQRVAIARLLLKDPALVILDEATAHLDSESEMLIQNALAEALHGRSSLVIAHRLSTVVAADQILVLDQGRIVERGRHDELVQTGGLYAELSRIQFERPGANGSGPHGRSGFGAAPAGNPLPLL